MTLFYSPGRNSFFDDAIHGTRTVFVEDEAAQKAILIAISEQEEDLHVALEAETDADEKATLQAQLESLSEERRLALLNPPMVEVPNADCRLPDDSLEFSAERHAELMAAQADGKCIRAGADGLPEITERIVPANEVLAAARAQRDRALAATDWTQLPDALTAAKRKAWAEHRKHLRELPVRIEELIAKGQDAAQAADLVQRNVANTAPKGDV
jgi:Phage tail assembly chaperone protein